MERCYGGELQPSPTTIDGEGHHGADKQTATASATELTAAHAAAKAQAAAAEWLAGKLDRLVLAQEQRQAQLADTIEQLTGECARGRAEAAASKAELAASEARLQVARAEIADVRARLDGLSAQIAVCLHSHSWRLTAPLRALRRVVSRAWRVNAVSAWDVDRPRDLAAASGVELPTPTDISECDGEQRASDGDEAAHLLGAQRGFLTHSMTRVGQLLTGIRTTPIILRRLTRQRSTSP